jgi:unsaturated chondroitin disaccharide hydrolase
MDARRLAVVAAAAWLAMSACPPHAAAQSLGALATHALDFAAQQLERSVAETADPTRFPRSTLADGRWRFEDSGDWTSGFFPGCLWLLYEHTSAPIWRTRAESWTAEMEDEKNDSGTHDVGFKILCSFGNGARLTSNAAYPAIIRRGAQSLASRFDADVGCTRSWNNHHFPVIIDNMMNLEILFWGAAHGGDPAWRDMAVSHALRTRQDHVRPDGSTYHLVDYDPSSGAVLERGTVQGWGDESTWARGQAWGLHGFAIAFRETGDARFLETARLLSGWFLDHLPADHVPYWDFDAPDIPNEPRDTSAAAIAAAGLLQLAALEPETAARARWRQGALDILRALCAPPYLAEGTSSRGLLLHGVGNRPAGSEVDVSLIYGDYYFLQALLAYRSMATDVPAGAMLSHAFVPNPFRPGFEIGFALAAPARVRLDLFDVRGAHVGRLADGWRRDGRHAATWDGRRGDGTPAAAGVYLCRFSAGGAARTTKLVLVR